MASRKRVLVVEDDAAILDAVTDLLADEGYAVETALNGHEGLVSLATGDAPPEVVVLDLVMPIVNGHEVLERMRADDRMRELPVVVVSASREPPPFGVRFVRKPFSAAELIEAIEYADRGAK